MHQMHYTVIWDNVSFHRSALVQNWDGFTISGPRLRFIQAMEEACDQIHAAAVQGWIPGRFLPIACDVDEILWPDPARRDSCLVFSVLCVSLCVSFCKKFEGDIVLIVVQIWPDFLIFECKVLIIV